MKIETENKIIGLPIFEDVQKRNSFLLMSRSAFSNYKFYNDLEKTRSEFPDDNVIDFIVKNKALSIEDFTKCLQDIIG